MHTISTTLLLVLSLTFTLGCQPPPSDPAAPEVCELAPGEVRVDASASPGWTETIPGAFSSTSDLFVREGATGVRRDFRLTAWAGYDAEVSVRATCPSGLLRCYGVGPVYSEEYGGAVVDGETCVGSETGSAWLVVGCRRPEEDVVLEVEVARRQESAACSYELAVSLYPE